MKVLIIDNYDSFTFNLVQLVRKITAIEPVVKRNDEFTMEEVAGYDKILLSPGPGVPAEAGNLLSLIQRFAAVKSILGVCLGHQAIAEVFGATLVRLEKVCHGVQSNIKLCKNNLLFEKMEASIAAGRYHSWVVGKEQFPETLEILAEDEEGNIMALKHQDYNLYGVQFHPESILTPLGEQIIYNWINS